VRKFPGWSCQNATPYHFRIAAGQEVDLVLEAPGDKFSRGVVLYLGEQRLPFGDALWALPVASLWEG